MVAVLFQIDQCHRDNRYLLKSVAKFVQGQT
jgi:hypothetical protein